LIDYGIIILISGVYEFKHMPTKSYIKYYNTGMSLKELLAIDEVKEVLLEELKVAVMLLEDMVVKVEEVSATLDEIALRSQKLAKNMNS